MTRFVLTPKAFLLLLLGLLTTASVAYAQQEERWSGKTCGAGRLYDAEETCRDVRDVAASDGGAVYWVDAQSGQDTNPGTEAQPFATISRTTQQGFLDPGDWVIIRAGVYREEIRPQEDGAVVGGDTLRVTWAAYPGEEVVVTGADVVQGSADGAEWTQQPNGSWRHEWVWDRLHIDDYTERDGREGIYGREVFVDNGEVLQAVAEGAPLSPGTFYVDIGSNTQQAVYLRTHDGTSPNGHTIEVGQRGQLFQTGGEPDGDAGRSGAFYRLIGLVFEHASTHNERAPVVLPRHSVAEGVTSRWNNAGGIRVAGSGVRITGAKVNYNGRTGIDGTAAPGADYITGIVVEHTEQRGNNAKGHDPFWHAGGGKFTRTRASVFRYNTYVDNEGPGFWLDYECHNNRVYGNVVDGNLGLGIAIELRSSNNLILNNIISRTQYVKEPFRGIAVSLQFSYHNLVAFNTFMRNDGGGILTWNNSIEAGAPYAPTRARHNDFYNNLFVENSQASAPGTNYHMQLVDLDEGLDVHTGFTNRADGNAYWPASAGSFGRLYHVRHPEGGNTGGTGNFSAQSLAEWRSLTPHDDNSFAVDVAGAHVMNPSDVQDGWRLAEGSQMIGQAVPLPNEYDAVLLDFEGNPRPANGADIGADQRSSGDGGGGDGGDDGGDDGSDDSDVVFAVNAGGPAYTGAGGTAYQADGAYDGGRSYRTGAAISGTSDDALYQSERYGSFSYAVPVSGAGAYRLTLRLAEIYHASSGQRVFDVSAEGQEVVTDLDLFAEAGGENAAYDVVRTVDVSDGTLNITFSGDVDGAKLSALVVEEAGSSSSFDPNAFYTLTASHSGKALDVQGGGTRDGANVHQYAPSGLPNQQWQIEALEDGYYRLVARHSGSCLDLRNSSTQNWANVQQGGCGSADSGGPQSQQWQIEPVGDSGLYKLTARHSGKALDVAEGSTENGANAHQYSYTGTPNQHWRIENVAGQASSIASGKAEALRQQAGNPQEFLLRSPEPNPSAGQARLRYELAEEAQVRLTVYDVLGRRVRTLVAGERQAAGRYAVRFEAGGLASGVYFARLVAEGAGGSRHVKTQKLVLVR